MNTFETMKHNIPEGATHHGVYGCDTDCYFKKDGEIYLLWKDENWSLSPFDHHRWVKPIPQPAYRHEKVTDSIFDLKEEFERGELYADSLGVHEVQGLAHLGACAQTGFLYRRIEVTERELWIQDALEAGQFEDRRVGSQEYIAVAKIYDELVNGKG